MTDPQGAAAPTTPETPAAVVATPSAKPQVLASELPPEALKARLDSAKEQARREMLAELGVTDTKDAKAAIAELKAIQDAKKSDLEKAQARIAELEGKAAKADHATQVASRRAAAELAALTDAQRAYVAKASGDDPLRQLETIDSMREAGLLATPPAAPSPAAGAATPPAASPAAPQQLGSTAPAAGAPPPSTTSPVDHAAVYRSLKQSNPFAASVYLQQHQRQIFPSQ